MATDKKISQLSSGAPAQAGDEYVVARSGANYKLTLTNIAASMPPIGATTPNTGAFTTLTNGLGAVGTPSYTFTGDANTGMWSPTADTVAWSTGGTERMRIDSSGNVGIGGTATAFAKVHVLGTLPTSSNASQGFRMTGEIPSGATTSARSFMSLPSTAAASFTLASLYHYEALQGTFGAGSAVTSQYGFFAGDSLTGATNNFGFYSNIASAANRYNFYAAGTADNYFAGNTAIGGGIDANHRLKVENTGALHAQLSVVDNVDYYDLQAWNKATSGDNKWISFLSDGGATLRGSITYNRGGAVVAYNTTSDYRAKDVYEQLGNSGAVIDALKVYRGKMKEATIERPMMVAHEAQEIVPYAVTGVKDAVDKDGKPVYQQMDHQVLVPLLIAELQSLRQRVAELEAK